MFHPDGAFHKEIQKLISACNISANTNDLHKQLQTWSWQEMSRFQSLECLANITQPSNFLDIFVLTITMFSNWI